MKRAYTCTFLSGRFGTLTLLASSEADAVMRACDMFGVRTFEVRAVPR